MVIIAINNTAKGFYRLVWLLPKPQREKAIIFLNID
jgi:hypothetical protein